MVFDGFLDFDGAANRVNHAGELGQQTVANCLEYAPSMGSDLRFDGLAVVLSYSRPRSFFVRTNEAAVSDDICHKYRSKTAFDTFLGHSLASPLMGEVYGRRVVVSMNRFHVWNGSNLVVVTDGEVRPLFPQ
jgi:hypothetical protein